MGRTVRKEMAGAILWLLVASAAALAQGPGGGGDGIWQRNAAFGELETFDLCNGHQPGSGMYHHHVNPICLRAQLEDNLVVVSTGRLGTKYAEKTSGWTHSPILGWAYDGYPVYGPYGYSDPLDSQSAVRRVQPSFRLRDITERHTLPDWVLPYLPQYSKNLASNQYGPDVSAKFPLSRYIADYEYVQGLGDLDQYNGRFTVTPEYPAGTYAYFVTIAADGSPIFPYVINVQLYGVANGGNAASVPAAASDYFRDGAYADASSDPQLAKWYTAGSKQYAQAISGFDPSSGPSTTWPVNRPAGVTVMGGNAAPVLADVQRVRFDGSMVYVNSNNLPSYVIGPWFDAMMTGGVFMNWASGSSRQLRVPRSPAAADTKSASGMGPVGVWVNGVAIFNTLDGASYSNSGRDDRGGGMVSAHAIHYSSASHERGPIALGSIAVAHPEFDAVFPATAEKAVADGKDWPTTLAGAAVTVTDSAGAQWPAGILYAGPEKVYYRVPEGAAPGFGRVTIAWGASSVSGNVNLAAAYPGLYAQTPDGLAVGEILRIHGKEQKQEAISGAAIDLGTDDVYLVLYATGLGSGPATAKIGGVDAEVTYSGPQGKWPGIDQVNLRIPSSLAGKGRVEVVITAGGKVSNPGHVVIQ